MNKKLKRVSYNITGTQLIKLNQEYAKHDTLRKEARND